MAARYFCDVCGTELLRNGPDRIRRRLGNVTVEVMVAHKAVWNGGHICEPCALKVLAEGQPAGHDCGYVATNYK